MAARLPTSWYDEHGRTMTVGGVGDGITLDLDDRHRYFTFTVDADQAIRFAHDLLERAYAVADCDEVTDALTALRALADRIERDQLRGEAILGDDR